MGLHDDFNKIQNRLFSELDLIIFVEEKTGDYNLEKLKALETDLHKYISASKDIRESHLYLEMELVYNIERNSTKSIEFNSYFDKWELRIWNFEFTDIEFYEVPKIVPKPILETLNKLSKRICNNIDPVQARIQEEFSNLFKLQNIIKNKIGEYSLNQEIDVPNKSNTLVTKLKKTQRQIGRPEDFPSDKKDGVNSSTKLKIEPIIQETADSISKKGSSNYESETIKLYLTCYIKHPKLSRNELSDKATELAASQTIKDQLINSRDKGARSGWEKKLDSKIDPNSLLHAQNLL